MERQRPMWKDGTSCSDQTHPHKHGTCHSLHDTGLWMTVPFSYTHQASFTTNSMRNKNDTDLDKELAPKEPTQNMGLVPGLEPVLSMRFLSGDRAAAAIGCDVAVRLANGFSSLVWVDIISTSIRIWPIKSLKSENTVGKRNEEGVIYGFSYTQSLNKPNWTWEIQCYPGWTLEQ